MKLNLKSFAKNAFAIFAVVVLAAGCSFLPGGDPSEDKYSFVTPTFKAGDIYCLQTSSDGVQENDYYCFDSATSGSVVVYMSGNSEYELKSIAFSYDSGESVVNGENWLSFILENDYVKVYNKANCFRHTDGKKGLLGTFSNGISTITFSKKGKGKITTESSSFSITYTSESGIVTISDSGSSLEFYYLTDGSLLPCRAISTLTKNDKLSFYVYMNYNEKGEELIDAIKKLPDGLHYELTQKAKTNDSNRADLVTVKTLLTENPYKTFSISPGQLNTITYSHHDKKGYVTPIDEIPANWFAGCTNLYKFHFGDNLSTRIKVGSGAFSGCTNLTEVWGSVSVKEFGENSFEGCSSLKDISFAASTTIQPNAFKDCSSDLIVRKSNVNSIIVSTDSSFTNPTTISTSANNLGTLLTSTYVGYYWKFN